MLYTPHFLVGAAILKYIPNPVVGLPLALASHIALDLIPHNDFDIEPGMTIRDVLLHDRKKRKMLFLALGIDGGLLVATFLWILLTRVNPVILLLGGLAAISPDLIEQSLLLFGKQLPAVQDKFQFRVPAKYGFISYPVVSIIAIWLLMKG